MKLIKYLGGLILIAILLLVFSAKFSSEQYRYECLGETVLEGDSRPMTIYIILEEYRWWVGLWSDSDGNLNLEIPNQALEYYPHIVEVGQQLQIYDWSKEELKGVFSKLSKIVSLNTPLGFFDGKCHEID